MEVMTMPYGTLELPRDMIDAVTSYARRERMSVAALFADLLSQRYGYTLSVTVVKPQSHKRIVEVPQEVREMTGIITLPPDRSDRDLVHDAVMSKYEELA